MLRNWFLCRALAGATPTGCNRAPVAAGNLPVAGAGDPSSAAKAFDERIAPIFKPPDPSS